MLHEIFSQSDTVIEQLDFTPDGMSPMDESIDWFHEYATVTKDVIVGFRDYEDTKYIIICHKPSGLRFKVRFGGADTNSNPDIVERLSEVPRRLIENNGNFNQGIWE